MTKPLITLIAFSLTLSLFLACENQSETKKEQPSSVNKKSLNPNGDSELALLMRDMYSEAERIKEQIAEGEKITISLDHGKILTAHATEPEKAASKEFKAFSQLYLNNIEQLKDSKGEEASKYFSKLVDNCMSCHQAICPGPLVKIKKLKKSKK